MKSLGAACALIGTLGCFHYVDVEPEALRPGRDARLAISFDGRTALARQIGPQARTLRGYVRQSDTTQVTLALARVTLTDGTDAVWNGEPLVVPSHYIIQTQTRTLAPIQTVLFVGSIIGLTIFASRLNAIGSSGPSAAAGSGAK